MAAAALKYVDFVPSHNLVEEPDKQTLVVDLSAAGTHAGFSTYLAC